MSAATANLARSSSVTNAEASPCFALPLKDGAADLDESALLKVILQMRRAILASAAGGYNLRE